MKHEDFIVSMKGIQKSFGGVHALTDGELTLRKGEILGLIGENGAGKSTLMKILSGVYQADAGVMMVDGKEVHYHEPRQALHDGICMIYQELNLVQHLSVGDNIFIGRESKKGWKLDRTKDNGRAEELLKELELDVSPNTIVNTLTVAKQQMIEIAKGISYDSKVLIMDEPTAALSINEIRDLFRVIQKLKAKGISIIYISHRLEELFEITDRVMVKTPSVKQLVMNLSGGNQQKVAIAKWLLRDCDILIFDEPTRGIDIGAKSEIYNLMNALIAQGKSIIMISSEMQELLSMSDRIIVMCEGSITGELDIADASQESIMALAVQRAV